MLAAGQAGCWAPRFRPPPCSFGCMMPPCASAPALALSHLSSGTAASTISPGTACCSSTTRGRPRPSSARTMSACAPEPCSATDGSCMGHSRGCLPGRLRRANATAPRTSLPASHQRSTPPAPAACVDPPQTPPQPQQRCQRVAAAPGPPGQPTARRPQPGPAASTRAPLRRPAPAPPGAAA